MSVNPPLRVEMTRGSGIECVHQVACVVVSVTRELIAAWGDPQYETYLRSAAKPLQAVPLVMTGVADRIHLTPDELALCCASHAGADIHVRTARSILRKAGLSPEYLQCRSHDKGEEDYFVCAGPADSLEAVLRHNCSGKHSGMLATAMILEESLNDYRSPKHPVQQRIFQVVSDLSEVSIDHIRDRVIPDGCGAPIYPLPLRNLALACAKYGSDSIDHPYTSATRRLRTAMCGHPVLVSGQGSWNTRLLEEAGEHLFAKGGAEGVFGIGLGTGVGIATKVLDGNHRATPVAILAVMRKLGLVPTESLDRLSEFELPVVRNNHGVQVGEMRAVF